MISSIGVTRVFPRQSPYIAAENATHKGVTTNDEGRDYWSGDSPVANVTESPTGDRNSRISGEVEAGSSCPEGQMQQNRVKPRHSFPAVRPAALGRRPEPN